MAEAVSGTVGFVSSRFCWESVSKRAPAKLSAIALVQALSVDRALLKAVPQNSVDFVYLDGAHEYGNVGREMEPYWNMISPGGMLAGHDYCSYGETELPCNGCQNQRLASSNHPSSVIRHPSSVIHYPSSL